ncbi:hypothetical protein HG549_12420 [Pseudomonas sp. SK]|uniref:hypothetical protein n=1 Tax=Pseudomonas sp. SK TaxID=2729423 RepID=UPI00146483BD|nr:hypothetical protein [Pseudomonas sp. SK]QJQ20698.1 hypothetical protein HG549_12420 [Pseudomonas sp. SK]
MFKYLTLSSIGVNFKNCTKLLMVMFAWAISSDILASSAVMKTESIRSLQLTVQLPEQLNILPEDWVALKYPSERRPQVVYGNEDGTVSFGISKLKKSELVQIDEVKDAVMNMMRNLEPQASSVTVDGRKGWIIQFTSKGFDANILNMQLYLMTNENLVIATFNMTAEKLSEFQALGEKTLRSIVFN